MIGDESYELRRVRADVANMRHVYAELEKKLPPVGALVLLLPKTVQDTIHIEAERRLMRPEKLAALILTMVARDNLFDAVIDK